MPLPRAANWLKKIAKIAATKSFKVIALKIMALRKLDRPRPPPFLQVFTVKSIKCISSSEV